MIMISIHRLDGILKLQTSSQQSHWSYNTKFTHSPTTLMG